MKPLRACASALALSSLAITAHAQLKIEITGVGANQIPLSVANFPGDTPLPKSGQTIADIIRADLTRSGMFKLIPSEQTVSESAAIDYAGWKAKGANDLVAGSVQPLANGQYVIRYKLFDTVKNASLSGLELTVPASLERLAAHKIADDVYQKLTGIPGVFSTRIAYVTKDGSTYWLEVADADGADAQTALKSSQPILTPKWSPDGNKLAYVSFETKKPVVYVQNLATRARQAVADYKSNNSAPSWSPMAAISAVALSKTGTTQIYLINASGGGLEQLTNTSTIDTEPCFSPDGKTIYFSSDRSGGAQIYKMDANGSNVTRVTFKGSYNVTPRLSPDGKSLAFISNRDGGYRLYLMDLASGSEQVLSDGPNDESPSFAPNGQYIIYSNKAGGRGTLAVVSTDGNIKQRISLQVGNVREPAWGPFSK